MRNKGVTLIELLIGIAIFSIVIVTVYSSFYMGMKIWKRSRDEESLNKMRIAMLKMEKEIKRSFLFSEVPFKGSENEVYFPNVVEAKDLEDISIISYTVKKDDSLGKNVLLRKEENFSGEKIRERELLSLDGEITFEYAFSRDLDSGEITWQDSWDSIKENKLPMGVKISIKKYKSNDIYNKVIFFEIASLRSR